MMTRSRRNFEDQVQKMSPPHVNTPPLRRSSRRHSLLPLLDLLDLPDFSDLPPAIKKPKAQHPVQRRLVRYVSHEEMFDASASQLDMFEEHFEEIDSHFDCDICEYFKKCSFSPPEMEAPPCTRRTPSPIRCDHIVFYDSDEETVHA